MTTPSAHGALFESLTAGAMTLPNRIVMAPLTRSRSEQPGNLQTAMHAEYYAQRAGAGLIVSEATQISPEGQGYAWTPGIHTPEQVKRWRLVTDAVHAAGGRIVCQLWHVGAISHQVFQPDGGKPVSASAWQPDGEAFVGDLHPDGPTVRHPEARALELDEIPRLIEDYRHATRCACEAGFDGVEVHGANGYLIDQFLRSSTNKRDDRYGGSVENRTRLLDEVVQAVVETWEPGRVGVRLSPFGGAGGSRDDDPLTLYTAAAQLLSGRGLAYLHVIRPNDYTGGGSAGADGEAVLRSMHDAFEGVVIANAGFEAEEAAQWVEAGKADAIAFGRLFISNPDLPARISAGGPYNEAKQETFYGGGTEGYTDYPTLEEARDAA